MRTTRSAHSGYTLVEMLVVLGIILVLSTLALTSVVSMLRSTHMHAATNLLITTADESRSKAVTLSRCARIDLTRMNPNGAGDLNRLTVDSICSCENFEGYTLAAPGDATFPDAKLQWAWHTNASSPPQVISDSSHALLLNGCGSSTPAYYWNPGYRVANATTDDYEIIVEGRIKALLNSTRDSDRSFGILGCVSDSGGNVNAYALSATIQPTAVGGVAARNIQSIVTIGKVSGSLSVPPAVIDSPGSPSPTCCLIEGVWYHFLLSVKQISGPGIAPGTGPVTLAGKIWADGELEPSAYTVGPVVDSAPLPNGYTGVYTQSCDALADDIALDVRSMRLMPQGLRIDTFEPTAGVTDPNGPNDYQLCDPVANSSSPYLFPIMFRPDGTCAVKSIIRISDMRSGDSCYVTINPNTGRAIMAHSLAEATAK